MFSRFDRQGSFRNANDAASKLPGCAVEPIKALHTVEDPLYVLVTAVHKQKIATLRLRRTVHVFSEVYETVAIIFSYNKLQAENAYNSDLVGSSSAATTSERLALTDDSGLDDRSTSLGLIE